MGFIQLVYFVDCIYISSSDFWSIKYINTDSRVWSVNVLHMRRIISFIILVDEMITHLVKGSQYWKDNYNRNFSKKNWNISLIEELVNKWRFGEPFFIDSAESKKSIFERHENKTEMTTKHHFDFILNLSLINVNTHKIRSLWVIEYSINEFHNFSHHESDISGLPAAM